MTMFLIEVRDTHNSTQASFLKEVFVNIEDAKAKIEELRKNSNGDFTYTLSEVPVVGTIDYLQEFCKEQAPYRLREYFNLSDEKIEEYSGEVEEVIRDIIDNYDNLYDAIDDRIRKLLGDDYIEPDFFNEDDEENEEENENEA